MCSSCYRRRKSYYGGDNTMRKTDKLCGIRIEFSTLTDIWTFFASSKLAFEKCYFHVEDAAIYSNGKRMAIPLKFTQEYFEKLIQYSFVAERLVLHMYPDNTMPSVIDDYKDFQKSHCEMVILMYDCNFVEIYCKDQSLIQSFITLCNNSIPAAVIQEKYEGTDLRTVFYV